MAAVISTNEFVFTAASDAYASLKRGKGQRPQAVMAFLGATTEDERDDVITQWGAGFVRRGLHEASVFFNRKSDEETANVFEVLRDSIDDDGFTSLDSDLSVTVVDDDIDPDVLQAAQNALSEGADPDEVADFIVANA